MSALVVDPEVRSYLAAVKEHLQDLDEGDRDDLLEDLEQHLAEVAAEGDGSLEERLGSPAVYAEELLASAGLRAAPARNGSLLERAGARIARSTGYRSIARLAETKTGRELRAFFPELRPGWWVLRGYLLVVALQIASDHRVRDNVPIPHVAGSSPVGLLAIGGALVLSVRLGRHALRSWSARVASVVANIVVVVVSLQAFSQVSSSYVEYQSVEQPYLAHPDGRAIGNFCPYSADGKLLNGVLLYDQDGVPVTEVNRDAFPAAVSNTSPSITNLYPRDVTAPDENGMMRSMSCPPSIAPAIGHRAAVQPKAAPSPSRKPPP
jgi:hypothetical protein